MVLALSMISKSAARHATTDADQWARRARSQTHRSATGPRWHANRDGVINATDRRLTALGRTLPASGGHPGQCGLRIRHIRRINAQSSFKAPPRPDSNAGAIGKFLRRSSKRLEVGPGLPTLPGCRSHNESSSPVHSGSSLVGAQASPLSGARAEGAPKALVV